MARARAPSLKQSLLPLSALFMTRLTNKQIQAILSLWDDYYTARYHEINDPEPPAAPEQLGRISRFLRPTDLGDAR